MINSVCVCVCVLLSLLLSLFSSLMEDIHLNLEVKTNFRLNQHYHGLLENLSGDQYKYKHLVKLMMYSSFVINANGDQFINDDVICV